MPKFCTKCGRPLQEGEVCHCSDAVPSQPVQKKPVQQKTLQQKQTQQTVQSKSRPTAKQTDDNSSVKYASVPRLASETRQKTRPKTSSDSMAKAKEIGSGIAQKAQEVWIGINDKVDSMNEAVEQDEFREYNEKQNPYEDENLIVPDNINACEGEIPVKQYRIALLRSRFQFTRAIGRLQITNKRLLIRASGKCLMGKTVIQHEFAIDEIAGLTITKDQRFGIIDMLFGIIVFFFFAMLSSAATNWLYSSVTSVLSTVLVIALVAISLFLFVKLKRHFLGKLCVMALASGSLFWHRMLTKQQAEYSERYKSYNSLYNYNNYTSDTSQNNNYEWYSFLSGLLLVVLILFVILSIYLLIKFCIKPNLAMDVQTKGGMTSIQIKGMVGNIGLQSSGLPTSTIGYSEVLPAEDTDMAIKEIGAIINDIQKLGDFGIQKWKVN